MIDLQGRRSQLAELEAELHTAFGCTSVAVVEYEHLGRLEHFDVGIVATNTASPWMSPSLLQKAPIWIDDSHPRAASSEIVARLNDGVVYLECCVRGPHGMCQTFPFRLPTPLHCYSCFAEVYMCWRERMESDFVVGRASLEQIALMDTLLPQYNFVPEIYVGKDGGVIDTRLSRSAFERLAMPTDR